jgi:hypothetical protein
MIRGDVLVLGIVAVVDDVTGLLLLSLEFLAATLDSNSFSSRSLTNSFCCSLRVVVKVQPTIEFVLPAASHPS